MDCERLSSWRVFAFFSSGSLREDGLQASSLPKPGAPFQSLTSMESWKAGSEQRGPVLPAPLAGLLSWPFLAKEGGAGSKLKNTEKEFKLHVEIWIIASVWVQRKSVWIENCESLEAEVTDGVGAVYGALHGTPFMLSAGARLSVNI